MDRYFEFPSTDPSFCLSHKFPEFGRIQVSGILGGKKGRPFIILLAAYGELCFFAPD